MDLREYEQNKFAIAEVLRSAAKDVPDHWTDLRRRVQSLLARLAEDRFNLVVVGRFSRGKTSVMNAIMRTDRLPTGITPLTSVITSVTYGSKERVVLNYAERILTNEVPIEDLPKYITQQGNPTFSASNWRRCSSPRRFCAAASILSIRRAWGLSSSKTP
jgi:Dynamin family